MGRYTIENLIEIMATLRGEPGCPWDKAQTRDSLKPFLLEEAYEVIDAIDKKGTDELVEELGDLLLQVVFHSRLGEEQGEFDLSDVITAVSEKMIRRHPHIFGEITVDGADEVLENWEDIKRKEKHVSTQAESMLNIPEVLPALMRALKVQEKAARVGFDWDDVKEAMDKVYEEMNELKEVYKTNASDRIREELGDLLFACVNVARFLKVDPELALRDATKKFIRRFGYVEREAAKNDKNLQNMNLQQMDKLWEQGKNLEKKF